MLCMFLRKANAPHFLFELLSLSFALSNSHLFDFQGCDRWWMCSYSWWTHFHPANNCIFPPSRLRFPWTLSCNQHNQICLQHNRSTSEKRIPWSCKVYLVSPRTVTGVREKQPFFQMSVHITALPWFCWKNTTTGHKPEVMSGERKVQYGITRFSLIFTRKWPDSKEKASSLSTVIKQQYSINSHFLVDRHLCCTQKPGAMPIVAITFETS